MTRGKHERIELDIEDLKQIVVRAALSDSDRNKLRAALDTLAFVTLELENRSASVGRLRKLLFGASTEKTRKVLAVVSKPKASPESEQSTTSADVGPAEGAATQPATTSAKPKAKGHGRNGAASYRGADKITVAHDSLKPEDPCPECDKGKLYAMQEPAVLVRVTGQAPLGAKVCECQRLRCNLCGEIFPAKAPPEMSGDKYDESAAAMIGMLKYGSGFPFHRLARMQSGMGIPLPAATQWDIVQQAARSVEPAYEELARQAAQGEVLHNDDTTAKILALMQSRTQPAASTGDTESIERTGVFTSGIVATGHGVRIALFFTGRKHAGENLAQLLARRAAELGPPIQMCDALSRNVPSEFKTILANCVSHGRRKFVDVVAQFPDECKHVLETLRDVYRNEAIAVERKMSADERLTWHQSQSGPLMEELDIWLRAQLDDNKVEPNSGLGDAIQYMIKHWHKLTQFLRVPGAPLDNNLCERALKKAILHRKNALFFKTENGAHVSDVFMSLIHTAELCGANPFDYLVALQRHAAEVRAAPAEWMPWNYERTRAGLAAAA